MQQQFLRFFKIDKVQLILIDVYFLALGCTIGMAKQSSESTSYTFLKVK
ncbi:hypothetical protein SAMN04489723_103203 [Algoriphagus aquimarinus]|uniref:Uncharacterized protein n=1 Tax=Algoriphagus aquimarinus TaxID=237018 RepID=A0A1I0XHR3_9BACT|nr:hypothetical protein SAMN04489723_103203 [Algoriphagus aquimarinus]